MTCRELQIRPDFKSTPTASGRKLVNVAAKMTLKHGK